MRLRAILVVLLDKVIRQDDGPPSRRHQPHTAASSQSALDSGGGTRPPFSRYVADAGVSCGPLHWRARAYAFYMPSGICSTGRLGVLVLLAVLTSCAAASTAATRAPTPSINPASLAQPSCTRSHFVISSSGPEIQGITTGSNQFWALLFERPPLPAGTSN